MFDVGFSELGVIGLVALIVIGPEQLPRVARTAGHLMGRLRRYVSDVKSDIGREMELADLKRIQEEVQDSARSIESAIREQVASVETDVQQSIGISRTDVLPSSHELADTSVAEMTSASILPIEVPPETASVENVVDANQMDLFGAPVSASEPPEKH
ncbi:MAG: Sec-independent protein translocase subunit [Rhodocyclales bacterium]|nr:Sec-independent protein translocase subunit [Rhodocyclales bacterium]